MSIHCYDRNTDRNRHSAHYWLSVGYRIKTGGSSSTFRTSIIAVVLSWRCWHIVMRLLIHVHGWFHARTEPWRYEDFPAQHRAERDVKFFLKNGERTPPAPSPLWEGAVTTASTAPALLPIEGEMPAGQRGSARGRRADHRWDWIVSLSHAKDAKDAELPMPTTLSLK